MTEFFLDLKDKPRVIDFLVAAMPFADTKERTKMETWVTEYHEGRHVQTDKLANAARTLAISTWASRYAVAYHFLHEGIEEEWNRVVAALRPSTALLMKRFRASVRAKSLDAVLNHEDVGTALHDEEMIEIGGVRASVCEAFWKEKGERLQPIIEAGKKELDGYQNRLNRLRELAAKFSSSMQDEVFSKIARYEDRIFFKGEILPLEILDEEVKYYTEQSEITPTDE